MCLSQFFLVKEIEKSSAKGKERAEGNGPGNLTRQSPIFWVCEYICVCVINRIYFHVKESEIVKYPEDTCIFLFFSFKGINYIQKYSPILVCSFEKLMQLFITTASNIYQYIKQFHCLKISLHVPR